MSTLLTVTNFNVVISVVGGWLVLVGVFSHLLSDALYLSEARKFELPEWGWGEKEIKMSSVY
jgi:hypothetical protein